jgi:hypothetical protein
MISLVASSSIIRFQIRTEARRSHKREAHLQTLETKLPVDEANVALFAKGHENVESFGCEPREQSFEDLFPRRIVQGVAVSISTLEIGKDRIEAVEIEERQRLLVCGQGSDCPVASDLSSPWRRSRDCRLRKRGSGRRWPGPLDKMASGYSADRTIHNIL